MSIHNVIISAAIFIAGYLLIITEKVHRTVVAILGGMLMILLKIVPQQKAFYYVDWNVIFLLVGMMIIVALIGKTGFPQYLAIRSAKLARGDPYLIMTYLIFITAILSAFLDNVTTVVLIAPITILIAKNLEISPVPFLISEAIASNIGGTATLIGDPPNMMIGSAAHIDFIYFIANVAPPIVIMLVITPFLIKIIMGKRLKVPYERKARIMEFDSSKLIKDKKLLKKTMIVFSLVVAGFFIHGYIDVEVATIAMIGAFLLILILPKQEELMRELLSQVEWPALFFFIGFFIMVGALEETGILKFIAQKLTKFLKGNLFLSSSVILWFSGFISAVVDNIPFVATMIPIIKYISVSMGLNPVNPLWWALSLGACLGGNMTMIGAAANVVISGISEKNGYKINFWEFFKYGFLITIFNLGISTFYIWIRYFVLKV